MRERMTEMEIPKTLVLATNNQNKKKEISRILSPLGFSFTTLQELGLSCEVEENGATFEENALIKGRAVCRLTGLPCIADDSGLEVDALNGAPGVYTARYAGEHATGDQNIDKLLSALRDVPREKRTARFVCTAAICLPSGEDTVVRGTSEGWIGYERIGSSGFGYDPVFMVEDRSYAELSAEEKDAISHRGQALRMLAEKMTALSKD